MLRVIHPNRWFFWAIAALLFATLGAMILLQIAIREIEKDAFSSGSGAALTWTDPEYPLWHTLHPDGFGISLKYPPNWQVEIDRLDSRTIFLESAKNFDENVTITLAKPAEEKIIRASLKIASESEIIVDGETGALLRGSDPKDKAMESVVLVQHSSNLYYIAGSTPEFEKIVRSIRFIQ